MFGWELARCRVPQVIKHALKATFLYDLILRWRGPAAPSAEPDVCRVIRRMVRPGWVCVDVGANNGAFSWLFAKLVGDGGLVVAFEPHPDNVALLRESMRRCGCAARVRIENAAVSDGACSHVALYPGKGRGSAEWNIVGRDIDGNTTQPALQVPATSLDAYFPATASIDFCKIDVEMAGAQVLAGMRRILTTAHPFVLMEFHDEVEWASRAELRNADYTLYDMNGRQLDLARDTQRLYHVLAVPLTRRLPARLLGSDAG